MRWVWLGILAGCYNPTIPENVPSGNGGVCPTPYRCHVGVCVAEPVTDAPGDLTGFDAPDTLVDATMIDATMIDATMIDAMADASVDACVPSCTGSTLDRCFGPTLQCSLGCSTSGGAHCERVIPANGVPVDFVDSVSVATTVTGGIAIFNTDTGEITGVVTRTAGAGVNANIRYEQVGSLGVFAFAGFAVDPSGEVRFFGSRPAVFYAGGDLSVGGKIDLSGGCYGITASCAGPGGGVGAVIGTLAGGCGPGGNGASSGPASNNDAGGGTASCGGSRHYEYTLRRWRCLASRRASAQRAGSC